jgi:hypothetical protein
MEKEKSSGDETSLISLGCKVVQIRRESFFYLINNRNLFLAREIAEHLRYSNKLRYMEIEFT